MSAWADVSVLIDSSVWLFARALNWRVGFPNRLQLAGGATKEIEDAVRAHPNSDLIVDARGVLEFPDGAFRPLRQAVASHNGRFLVIGDSLDKPFFEDSLGVAHWEVIGGNGEHVAGVWGGSCATDELRQLMQRVLDTRLDFAKQWIAESYEPGWKRLESTPLRASGVFDATRVIRHAARFVNIADMMAFRLDEVIREHRLGYDRELGILAVSLRGSAVAVAVALMCGYHKILQVVDHMGPKYRLLEEHSLRPRVFSGEYILITDFVIGGTELRSAVAYAHQRGAMLRHVISLGRLLQADQYGEDVRVHSLVELGSAVPTLEYSFP